jgi:predicted 3-demethylubiquinone-9 3-methyltransferase (glyoxalase superfamily)
MNKISPFLWFNDDAEAAAEFYLSVFPGSHKLSELRAGTAGPGPAGSLVVVDLQLLDQQVTFLNGGPMHRLTEAFSLVVRCKDQAEIDHYWNILLEGGAEMACGWLRDKFGVCWQIVPENLQSLLKPAAAMRAMMSMKKLDIAALERAGAADASA